MRRLFLGKLIKQKTAVQVLKDAEGFLFLDRIADKIIDAKEPRRVKTFFHPTGQLALDEQCRPLATEHDREAA